MHKANFFIVGAPKCGTTAWWSWLSAHPQVFMTPSKEPHYFCDDLPGFRSVKDAEEYAALYKGSGGFPIRGEASVLYLFSQRAATNIQSYNPNARVLVFTRERSRFLASYHQQLLLNLDEDKQTLEAAWSVESERRERGGYPLNCREGRLLHYSEVARFGAQLARYIQHFPVRNVMVLEFESWTRDPLHAFRAVERFLELDHAPAPEFDTLNVARQSRSRRLAKLYRRPPPPLLGAWKMIRRVLGIPSGALSARVRGWNEFPVTVPALSPSMTARIERHYQDDAHLLTDLVSGLPHKVYGRA